MHVFIVCWEFDVAGKGRCPQQQYVGAVLGLHSIFVAVLTHSRFNAAGSRHCRFPACRGREWNFGVEDKDTAPDCFKEGALEPCYLS